MFRRGTLSYAMVVMAACALSISGLVFSGQATTQARVAGPSQGPGGGSPSWQVPGGIPGKLEGRDAEGTESWRSVDHALHFTVRRTGNRPTDFLWARVPPGSPVPDPLAAAPPPRGRSPSPIGRIQRSPPVVGVRSE